MRTGAPRLARDLHRIVTAPTRRRAAGPECQDHQGSAAPRHPEDGGSRPRRRAGKPGRPRRGVRRAGRKSWGHWVGRKRPRL